MIRAILVGASPEPGGQAVAKILRSLRPTSRDLKIGVDGGVLQWKKIGARPDFAVGDFDSLKNPKALEGLIHIRLPEEKDRSDLYYACLAAQQLGATELVCVGVGGGRLDHQMAVVFDLSEISEHVPVSALDPSAETLFLSREVDTWQRKLPRGSLFSLFAMPAASGVTLTGLKYPLKDAHLKASSHGLSNVARGGLVKVCLKRGRLMIVLPT
jgi:thiamine pyrophosphokinase